MPRHLEQKTIDDACEAAFQRYAKLGLVEGSLHFSYEVQGWAKLLHDNNADFSFIRQRINELLTLLEKRNREDA